MNKYLGFLLSLGLQGHLNVLSVADICDYLTRVSYKCYHHYFYW